MNRTHKNLVNLMSSAAFMSVAATGTAMAQSEAPAAPAAAEGTSGLAEIVVTAQRRAENLQEVPITIAAFDQKALQRDSIYTLGDIGAKVPSMQIRPLPTGAVNLQFSIRGVEPQAPDIMQDTPTAVYMNGMYIARGNGLDLAAADIERIEVLKGPQGSLYGRNATAGAINIITVKPVLGELKTKVQGTLGSRDLRLGKASINVPLGDRFAVLGSVFYRTQDGFIRNSGPGGGRFDDRRSFAIRGDVRWEPTSDITIDYGADYAKTRYRATPGQCLEVNPGAPFGSPATAVCSPTESRSLSAGYDVPFSKVSSQDHTLTAEWLGSDDLTVRSITGYRKINDKLFYSLTDQGTNFRIDNGPINAPGLPIDAPARPSTTRQHQFSQEIQLLGKIGANFDYVVGGFYFDEKAREDTGLPFTNNLSLVMNTSPLPAVVPVGSRFIVLGARSIDAKSSSKAIFGQFTLRPLGTEMLDVVLDLRYTWDKREGDFVRLDSARFFITPDNRLLSGTTLRPVTVYTPTFSTGSASRSDHKFTPGITVRFRPNDDVMLYAKAINGYRAGGFSSRAFNAALFAEGFGPESVWNYEVGVKSEFLDRRVRLNASAFRYDFKDLQTSVNCFPALSGCAQDINAGKSRTNGFEVELVVAPVEGLQVGANYSYIDPKFTKVVDPVLGDITSQFVNRAIRNNLSITGDYDFPQTSMGIPSIHVNYTYASRRRVFSPGSTATATDDVLRFQPGYGLLDGRMSLRDIPVGGGKAEVALWGKNLTKKSYLVFGGATDLQITNEYGYFGAPRSFGVDVTFRY